MRLFWLSLLLIMGAGSEPLRAHQAMSGWAYPYSCCAGNDCAEVSPAAVQETPAGYVVTVRPGTHPMWRSDRPAPLVVRIPYREAKPSPDGHWHICINGSGELLCFFAALGGS